jgi:N-acetylmuramoyl-L-alanine amidase
VAKKHVVVQGECMQKIAALYGFGDYRVIYGAPENAELRRTRPDPNQLFPGDVVTIPDVKGKTVSAQTGQKHKFTAELPDRWLRLVMKNHEHEPLADEPYELRVKSGPTFQGSTDGSGKIEQLMPRRSELAELVIAGRTYELHLGSLNPLRDTPDAGVSGVQGRLKNLGYYCGPTTGVLDHATRIAVAFFQGDHGLEADGELKEPTLRKLEQVHGS